VTYFGNVSDSNWWLLSNVLMHISKPYSEMVANWNNWRSRIGLYQGTECYSVLKSNLADQTGHANLPQRHWFTSEQRPVSWHSPLLEELHQEEWPLMQLKRRTKTEWRHSFVDIYEVTIQYLRSLAN